MSAMTASRPAGSENDRLGRSLVRGQEALANLWVPFSVGRCTRGVDEVTPAHRRCDDGDAVSALERSGYEGSGLNETFSGPD
jgi:hypothetical protein